MDQQLWEKCVEFHGHVCPAVTMGYKACEAVQEKMGPDFFQGELVVVTENDACGTDAVQVITGCTFGKGNLVYRDTDKMAWSFFNKTSGESMRVILKPLEEIKDRSEFQQFIANAPGDVLFNFSKPSFALLQKPRRLPSAVCEACGETAGQHRMRVQNGEKVCLDCFTDYI